MISMCKRAIGAAAVVLGAALWAMPAQAEEAKAAKPFAGTETVTAENLDAMRGRAVGPIDIEALLSAELTDNDFSGAIFIDASTLPAGALNEVAGSFNNSSGIVTVVQNIGSGVIIQTATIVSVNFTTD